MAVSRDDDFDVPESGAIFTLGRSKFGEKLLNKFWLKNDTVKCLACGDEHTAIISGKGDIFMFGSNEWGQLGLGHTNSVHKPTRIKHKVLKQEKIAQVNCGRHHTILVTVKGNIYAMGANNENQLGELDVEVVSTSITEPSLVKQRGRKAGASIKQISCGAEHTAFLYDDGNVYTYGSDSEGQLGSKGQGERIEIDEKVDSITCGYYHTALVTESGRLYTFGESECGKLGQAGVGAGDSSTSTPTRVMLPSSDETRIASVSCGGSHTVCVTDDGDAYSFGDGENGQLGHGTTGLQQTNTPHLISFKGKRRVKIAKSFCGENNTALLSDKGDLYTFGDGRHAKLGHGEENFSNQFSPMFVKRFTYFVIDKVSCGGCHVVVTGTIKPALPSSDDLDLDSPDELVPDPVDELELTAARSRRRDLGEPKLSRTLPPLTSSMQADDLKILKRVEQEKIFAEEKEIEEKIKETSSLKPIPKQRKKISTPLVVDKKFNHESDSEKKVLSKKIESDVSVTEDSDEDSSIDEQNSVEEEDEEEEEENKIEEKKIAEKKKEKEIKKKKFGLFSKRRQNKKKVDISTDEDDEEDSEMEKDTKIDNKHDSKQKKKLLKDEKIESEDNEISESSNEEKKDKSSKDNVDSKKKSKKTKNKEKENKHEGSNKETDDDKTDSENDDNEKPEKNGHKNDDSKKKEDDKKNKDDDSTSLKKSKTCILL